MGKEACKIEQSKINEEEMCEVNLQGTIPETDTGALQISQQFLADIKQELLLNHIISARQKRIESVCVKMVELEWKPSISTFTSISFGLQCTELNISREIVLMSEKNKNVSRVIE